MGAVVIIRVISRFELHLRFGELLITAWNLWGGTFFAVVSHSGPVFPLLGYFYGVIRVKRRVDIYDVFSAGAILFLVCQVYRV